MLNRIVFVLLKLTASSCGRGHREWACPSVSTPAWKYLPISDLMPQQCSSFSTGKTDVLIYTHLVLLRSSHYYMYSVWYKMFLKLQVWKRGAVWSLGSNAGLFARKCCTSLHPHTTVEQTLSGHATHWVNNPHMHLNE